MDQFFVSVLMTAYNREKYIGEAIESVLASTYTNFELIIVDDCSKDKTVEIARSYELRDNRIKVYENEKNLGDYPNRNKAASYATGNYITYLDSDDLIYSHGLAKMVEAATRYPDAGLFLSTRHFEPNIADNIYLTPKESFLLHFEKTGFLETGPLCTLINYKNFQQIGGFSGRRMIGDTELWLKFAMLFPIVKIEKHLGFYRRHDNQETNVGEYYYLVDIIDVYKKVLHSPDFPLPQKRRQYFFRVITPRMLIIIKIAIKTLNITKLKLLIQVFKIVFKDDANKSLTGT